jgi:hypothetical protein
MRSAAASRWARENLRRVFFAGAGDSGDGAAEGFIGGLPRRLAGP